MNTAQERREIGYLRTNPELVPGSPGLSGLETAFLQIKASWLNTVYATELQKIVSRIVSDRAENPIQNVVCLGIGGSTFTQDLTQMVVLFQIASQLGEANPDLTGNIVVQDPLLQNQNNEFKALFEKHGCRVVEDPEAFDHVGPNTFVYSPWTTMEPLMEGLRGKPVTDLGLFIGNDLKHLINSYPKVNFDASEEDLLWYHELANTMLDERICSHDLVPCHRPNGTLYDASHPLAGLQIWWRPARNETQRAQDKVMACLGSAAKLGFNETLVVFLRGYSAGFKDLTMKMQEELVHSYMITRERSGGEKTVWVEHVKYFLGEMPEVEKEAHRRIAKGFKSTRRLATRFKGGDLTALRTFYSYRRF